MHGQLLTRKISTEDKDIVLIIDEERALIDVP